MKKILTAICCTALIFGTAITANAAENLDRDYIETEIWEDMWHGKGDNGIDFPEASYKHHLLDKWIDDNYGSDEYDWTELGELKYEYKRYYQDTIEEWNFNDDNGNWTIETPEHSYSFTLWQNNWLMTDENGDTVDSFPTFNTLEEESNSDDYEIHDNDADSPRVIGKVTSGTEKPSDGLSDENNVDTVKINTKPSESDSERSGANPLMIVGVVAAVAVVGGVGFYMTRK